MAKKVKEDEAEAPVFKFPEFDEKEYLRGEIRDAKAIISSALVAIPMAACAAMITGSFHPTLGIVVGLAGFGVIYFLFKMLFKDMTGFKAKHWLMTMGGYFLTFLALWILMINPPFMDLTGPVIEKPQYATVYGNFTAVDGDTYTFDLTPSGQGPVTADIAAGVASDSAGNGNTAATQFSRTYDSVAPTVTMSSAASNPTNASPIPVTVQFSETVTGFVAGDILPGNGAVSNFTAVDGDTYTFDLTPSAQGPVTADIGAGAASDSAGNVNTAATQFSRTYDSVAPTVTMSSTASDPTSTSPIPVTVQFSETVTGFVAGDILPGNGTVSNFVAVDGDTYTFDLTPSAQGPVTADIAAGVASDSAGNGNTIAAQFQRTYTSVYNLFLPLILR